MKFMNVILIGLFILTNVQAAEKSTKTLLEKTVAAEHRSHKNKMRDQYRHPVETLMFFGIQPDMTVLEILPGTGWYTEVLASLLKDKGKLTVASFGADNPNDYLRGIHLKFVDKLNAHPKIYRDMTRVVFEQNGSYLKEVIDNSQDMVVTFRNTHNWIRYGGIKEAYRSFYRVLKKGGVLGVVQHRANKGDDAKQSAQKGYVPESYLIGLIEDQGFELVDKTEINANPKDTKDYPEGVWSLPPSLREKKTNQDKYLAIGESDRMTLRFIKL